MRERFRSSKNEKTPWDWWFTLLTWETFPSNDKQAQAHWQALLFKVLIISPYCKKDGSSIEQTEFTSTKDALCQVWFKVAQWFWRRFLKVVNAFLQHHYYLPLENDAVLYLNVNSLHPRMLCAKFGWLALQWYWRRFSKIVNTFIKCHNYIPLEMRAVLNLNKL